jgi:hypothetical protein
MAIINEWDGEKLVIDMTGNSDDSFNVNFGRKFLKRITNSIQVSGKNLVGTSVGSAAIMVSNLKETDPDRDALSDILGENITLKANFTQMWLTQFAFNSGYVKFTEMSAINGGEIIIALNKDD